MKEVLSKVRDVDGRPKQRLSLRGRLRVPRHYVSSGLHALSGDGRSFSRVFNVPIKYGLALCGVLVAVALAAVEVRHPSTAARGAGPRRRRRH